MRDSRRPPVVPIYDKMSGDTHLFQTRYPTNDERVAFSFEAWQKEGKKMVNHLLPTRQKYGLRVTTGFIPGTLAVDGKTFSSNPNDSDYREDWKNILDSEFPDLVAAVAEVMFEGTKAQAQDEIEIVMATSDGSILERDKKVEPKPADPPRQEPHPMSSTSAPQ